MPNPTFFSPPLVNQITTFYRCYGRHGMVLISIAVLLVQTFVSPGLRMSPRAHFHLSTTVAHKHVSEVRHRHADHDADSEHHHPHPHSHAKPATHDHDVDSSDVVYVNAHEQASPSVQASNRMALDLDGMLFHQKPPSTDTADRVVFTELALSFCTRTEPPLERPPRVVI